MIAFGGSYENELMVCDKSLDEIDRSTAAWIIQVNTFWQFAHFC